MNTYGNTTRKEAGYEKESEEEKPKEGSDTLSNRDITGCSIGFPKTPERITRHL